MLRTYSMTGSVFLFPGFRDYFKARTTIVSACRPYFGQISKLLDSMSSDPFSPISFGRLIHICTITESVLLFPGFFDYFKARTTFVSAASRPNFGQMSILFGSTSSDPFSPISFGRLIQTYSKTRLVLAFPVFLGPSTARATLVSASRLVSMVVG